MCGIAGFRRGARGWSAPELQRLTDALAHRGPDAEGHYHDADRGVYLGHRRLSILDLTEAANQPMFSHDRRWVMVYNGEVYNYLDIARELNISARTRSDSEILLEAISLEGPAAAARRFNGMFALAAYDTHRGELHLMRDPVGIKPLVYYHQGGEFAFASELKALLTLDIPRTLNPQAVADYLHYEYVPGPQTIYKHHYKLPPGGHLTVTRDGSLSLSIYRALTELLHRPTGAKTDGEHQEAFEAALTASLRRQQVADVPVGAFLSGGTDSSLVVAAYQQVSPEPVRTFTIGFEEASHNEAPYAEAVAKILGTRHLTLPLRAQLAMEPTHHLADHYDEPFAAPSTLPSLAVCRLAREHVRVALAGDGGDELFMGYGSYAWQQRLRRLDAFGGGVLRAGAAAALRLARPFTNGTHAHAIRVLQADGGAANWPEVWSQEQDMFADAELRGLLREAPNGATLGPIWNDIRARGLHPWEALALFDLTTYLPHDLLYKMDIASMAVGLEMRVPLLDLEVIEVALNLPIHLRREGSHAKVLMKRVLERHLPRDLVHRPKWGFPAPVGTWLKGPLSGMIDTLLNKEALEQCGVLDAGVVQRLVRDFRGGEHHDYKRVWALVVLQQWLIHEQNLTPSSARA
jgi:asparagine synthase (glutamine-hydrolysing)